MTNAATRSPLCKGVCNEQGLCRGWQSVGAANKQQPIVTSEGAALIAVKRRESGTGLTEETASDSVHRKAYAMPEREMKRHLSAG